MNYFLIPGNPPAVHFYKQWQDEIHPTIPGSKTFVSAYPKLDKTNNSVQFMNLVHETHLHQLKKFHEVTKAPINLLAHSLGAYFALRLLEDAPELINKAILIHPFLRAPGKRGQLILKTVALLQKVGPIPKFIIKNRNVLERFSQELTHITNDELEMTFHIAKHESKIIGDDLSDIKMQTHHREKIVVFFNKKDTWCTNQVVYGLKNQVKMVECHEPHDFIVNKEHRLSLLSKINR
jgi:predicted alpha/beta hydrolase family esterase